MSNKDRQIKEQAGEAKPSTSSGQPVDRKDIRRFMIIELTDEKKGPPKSILKRKLLPIYNPPVISVDPNVIEIPDDDIDDTDQKVIEISDDECDEFCRRSPELLSERGQWLYAKKYVKKPRPTQVEIEKPGEEKDEGDEPEPRLLNFELDIDRSDHTYCKPQADT